MAVKLFADTNWVVAAYFRNKLPHRSEIVRRFIEKQHQSWLISSAVLLECENIFRTGAGESNPTEWLSLQQDLGTRVIITSETWEEAAGKAGNLFQRFSHQGRLGTMDMLILASALKAEATHFLSFDTNSNLRALAALLKLKVVPELTPEDRRRMARFR